MTDPEWIDPDDAPAWTAEDFQTAQHSRDTIVIRASKGNLSMTSQTR